MPKTYAKTNIKIPQIARWRVSGIADNKIAQMLGMSPIGVAQIVATQEYKDYEEAILNGHLSKMDEALAGNVDAIRKNFQIAVPAAMRALVDAVTQRKDLKACLTAAKEILDRDPDRTLSTATAENQEPDISPEQLQAAIDVGNKIASTQQDKTKVN
jgi:hypothetical protein